MPHKRAKRSVREQQAREKGFDLPPRAVKDSLDDAPKGALRVLNAASIRAEFKERKRKRDMEAPDGGPGREGAPKKRKTQEEKEKEDLKLRPGERLQDFNRRVDQALTPRIKASKSAKKPPPKPSSTGAAAVPAAFPTLPQRRERKTEFDVLPKQKRVGDVVQAPPTLTKLPRNAKSTAKGGAAGAGGEGVKGRGSGSRVDGVVSIATRLALEQERERVVERYRMLREGRTQARVRAEEGE